MKGGVEVDGRAGLLGALCAVFGCNGLRMDALERMSAVCEVRLGSSFGLVLGSLMSFSHGPLVFVSH